MRERKRREGKGAEEGRREEIFKKLVHVIVGVVKFEIHKAGWQRRSSGRSSRCSSLQRQNSFLPRGHARCVPSLFSRVWLFANPWTVALQDPLSMGFSRHEYWSGLPCPQPRDWTHISRASCIGRRVLYHWHHLGSLGAVSPSSDRMRRTHITKSAEWRGAKEPLVQVKEETEKPGLKFSIQETKTMASGPITSRQIDRNKVKAVRFPWAPKSLQTVTAAVKVKDACSLEEKLWQT